MILRTTIFGALLAMPAWAQEPVQLDETALQSCLSGARGALAAGAARIDDVMDCVGNQADICMSLPDGQTTMGMIDCLAAETGWWDVQLNEIYAAQRQGRAALQDDIGSDQMPPPLDSLVEMERAWIGWRDKWCTFEASAYAGGSLARVVAARCLLDETARHALRLAADLDAPKGN
ncbi:DUF1311 domain-containing protein [Paracoccus sp. Z118]|uniref:lysozyme inhibitor LprI family protein n=1 Tax=Paracoccus sp. Z118 TaxID=2851017 RepID=UPI001C2BACA8|nr:lysozyme inhibitor LprI family protein [Paracoccus sp. Z118]MBV0892283.1 DUF1311 domain-containing protein [Paracoccus sp. Z118]